MPRLAVKFLPGVALLSAALGAALVVGAESETVRVSRSGLGAYEASLAAHPRGFAVAWHDTRQGLPEVHARLLDGSGRPVSEEYRLTEAAGRAYGNAEVYLAVVDEQELPNGIESAATRVTDTAGESIGAYVDWNGSRFGLAWSDEVDPGLPHDVFFQRYAANGVPDGGARRLTDNPTASLIPAIRGAGSQFALAWNEDLVDARGDHRGGGRSEIVFAFAPE